MCVVHIHDCFVSMEDGKEREARVQAVLKKPFGMRDLDRAVNAALR